MRTGAEYRAALRDGRRVWVMGEGLVEDVTTHPATRAMVDVYVAWYDLLRDPAWRDIGPGRSVVRAQRDVTPCRVAKQVVPSDIFVDHRPGRRMRCHILDQTLSHDPDSPPVTQGCPVLRPCPHRLLLPYCGLVSEPPAQCLPAAERNERFLAHADMFRHRKRFAAQCRPSFIDRQPIEF